MTMLKVVHIDDNATFRGHLRLVFESESLQIADFHNSVQAREQVMSGQSDVVVVDSSGFDLAGEALRSGVNIATVVLSASPTHAPFVPTLRLSKIDYDWPNKLTEFFYGLAAMKQAVSRRAAEGVGHRDFFAEFTAEDREHYAGKVLVISHPEERIVHAASSISDAESFIRYQLKPYSRCSLLQVPDAGVLTLDQLECD